MLTPNVVPDFTALRVAVVGDLIADHYLFARPTRLSREAPVMVMRHAGEEISPGGAGNVARNAWSFGSQTLVLGAVGRDGNGRELLRLLEREQIDVRGIQTVPDWTTPTKTRILGAEPGRTMHQVLRVDREPDAPVDEDVHRAVAEEIRSLAGRIDALLISDYGYGFCSSELGRAAREVKQAGAVVVLDPRREFEAFRGVTAITPNLEELALATGRSLESMASQVEVNRAAMALVERYEPDWVLVTMGNRGMALYSLDHPQGILIRAAGSESVIDVSGAGDTAAAAFTLALSAGLEGPRAMRLANASAGVVVMEQGTAVCSVSKLRSALPTSPQPSASAASVAPVGP